MPTNASSSTSRSADPGNLAGEPGCAAAAGPLRLPRVVYTRVETRVNPDYQILGWSPRAAALVSARELEGFFHGVLGQADSLIGFRRACLFAPLRAPGGAHGVAPTWIAGVARASDKPDRHGRVGVLNFAVLLLTHAHAEAIGYDPWPLFDDSLCKEAFPFVDDPQAPVTDFEWTRHAPRSPIGEPRAAGEVEALAAGRTVLLRATTLDDAVTGTQRLEARMRALYRDLTPRQRAAVPFVTASFRPNTSATRFRLIGAASGAAIDETVWQPVAVPHGSGSPDSTAVSAWVRRPATADAVDDRADAPAAKPPRSSGSRSRPAWRVGVAALRRVMCRPAIGLPIGVGIVALLGVALHGTLSPARDDLRDEGQRAGGALDEASAIAADATASANAAMPAAPGFTPQATLSPGAQEALDGWRAAWRETGLGAAEPTGERLRAFRTFAGAWRPWLAEHAPADAADWPPALTRLAMEVALAGWRLAGSDERELPIELRLAVDGRRLAPGYAVHPLRIDLVPAGAMLPTRHWRLTRPVERTATDTPAASPINFPLRFASGETAGSLRIRATLHLPVRSCNDDSRSGESDDPASKGAEDAAAEDALAPRKAHLWEPFRSTPLRGDAAEASNDDGSRPRTLELYARFDMPALATMLAAGAPAPIRLRDDAGTTFLELRVVAVRVTPTEATRHAGFPSTELSLQVAE